MFALTPNWGSRFSPTPSLYSYIDAPAPRQAPVCYCPEPGLPKPNEKLVESLFAARGDDLLRYLTSRLPNGEDAKDLAQEAYLRLLRHPEPYLFRIAASRSQY